MEFLGFLWASALQIYDMVSSRYSVRENAPICRKHDIFGWFNSLEESLTICTNRIKQSGDSEYYINETLLHESVHAAQACKSGDGYIEPFGMALKTMLLNQVRRDGVNAAVRIGGDGNRAIEHEAFWLEDKPDKVRYVVRKYCF